MHRGFMHAFKPDFLGSPQGFKHMAASAEKSPRAAGPPSQGVKAAAVSTASKQRVRGTEALLLSPKGGDFMTLLEDAERRDTERLSSRSAVPSPRTEKPAPPTGGRPKNIPMVAMPLREIDLPTPGEAGSRSGRKSSRAYPTPRASPMPSTPKAPQRPRTPTPTQLAAVGGPPTFRGFQCAE